MFIDTAFGRPIYERLFALGFNNVFEVKFGLTHVLAGKAPKSQILSI
jgi:hypothetical protein